MSKFRLYAEIETATRDSCEVLVTMEDDLGQTCVIDAQTMAFPPPARDWRPMMDAARRWLVEYTQGR